MAEPTASVRRVEVAPNARDRFAFLICLWGSSKDTSTTPLGMFSSRCLAWRAEGSRAANHKLTG